MAVWFKHFNTAHQGQLITDLMAQKRYDCVALWYVILEFISRYEEEHASGVASVPLDTLARAMNMKPSRTRRLLDEISSVSRSDLICETDEKQPRNVVFRLANWAKLQQTRGIYDRHKKSITPVEVRSKKLEVRSEERKQIQKTTPSAATDAQRFIGTYVKSYQTKYGGKARPDLGGKTQGGIKRLLADYPVDRACEMIQVYLQMDDQWFKTKAHDFETFAQNLTKIGLALDTGKERGGLSRWEQEMLEKEKKNDVSRISNAAAETEELFR